MTLQTATARRIEPPPTGRPLVVPASSPADVRRAILHAPRRSACRSPSAPPGTAPTRRSTAACVRRHLGGWRPSWSTPTAGSPVSAPAPSGATSPPPPRRSGSAPLSGSHPRRRRHRLHARRRAELALAPLRARRRQPAARPRRHRRRAAASSPSPEENADLFWALRGGGGGFGVVTALEFRLHRVPQVYAGTAYFRVERAAATLARYRDWIAGAPDALSTAVLLTRMEDGRARARDPGDVRRRRRSRRAACCARCSRRPATPFADGMRRCATPTPRWAARRRARSSCSTSCSDAAIDGDRGRGASRGPTVEVRHWGGAMAAPEPGAGPVGARGAAAVGDRRRRGARRCGRTGPAGRS